MTSTYHLSQICNSSNILYYVFISFVGIGSIEFQVESTAANVAVDS